MKIFIFLRSKALVIHIYCIAKHLVCNTCEKVLVWNEPKSILIWMLDTTPSVLESNNFSVPKGLKTDRWWTLICDSRHAGAPQALIQPQPDDCDISAICRLLWQSSCCDNAMRFGAVSQLCSSCQEDDLDYVSVTCDDNNSFCYFQRRRGPGTNQFIPKLHESLLWNPRKHNSQKELEAFDLCVPVMLFRGATWSQPRIGESVDPMVPPITPIPLLNYNVCPKTAF